MALAALFLSASCATLFQGNKEEVMVTSDPAGAQVVVNDGRSGTTPYSMKVGRDDDLQIHVSKAGYSSTDITDTSHMEWGYFVADFVFTGLIGLGVDGIDGAMFYHDQTMVTATSRPSDAACRLGRNTRPASGTNEGRRSRAPDVN